MTKCLFNDRFYSQIKVEFFLAKISRYKRLKRNAFCELNMTEPINNRATFFKHS